jgi:hypothetical protein
MGKTAKDYAEDYTDPELRERLKEEIKAGDRGGAPGKWSARKSELLVREYEQAGGGYRHPERRSESQRHLKQWEREEWTTADGTGRARQGDGTHRYLPKDAWEAMSPEEREATERAKLEGDAHGAGAVPNTPKAKAARKAAELDELPAAEAARAARHLDPEEARVALDFERAHKARKTVLEPLERAAGR